ncbi:MAG TPA: rhomboid family intramembrane serine protease [Candidatus Nanoarchaeia archaeon]|nr:rhomboid family intramembrane serine protease [Candidatus Nanoarchaeia archaeon]
MTDKSFRYGTLWLLGIIVLAYLAQIFVPGFKDLFVLDATKVIDEPWRLVTSIFLHGSIAHLFLNCFALFLFGLILEKEIGTKNFLLLFFCSGMLAGIGAVLFYPSSLGASGAIYGIMGMLAVLKPGMTVWVSYVPMPMIVAIFVWAAIDFFGIFMPSNVANAAHLAGLFFGVIAGILHRIFYSKPKTSKTGHLDPYDEGALDDYERKSGLR